MFIGFYNPSIILTFIGLFCTIIGIKFAICGKVGISLILLLASGICDTFDGTIASLIKRNEKEKKYGVELDSLVDIACFGIFPIIIAISLDYTSLLDILIYCFYIFCGVTRLAYFNVDKDNKSFFRGLPITMSSFILPIVMLLSKSEIIVVGTLLILGILFIIDFKIPKSSLKLKLLYLLLGIIIISLIILKLFI